MKLKYSPNATLPCLAWLASIKRSTGECQIEHGRLLETREKFFVEGVWPGSFPNGNFDRCESFFGSGAIQRSVDEIVFIPSSATVDYLYHSENKDRIMCSNSLPFLLAACDDELKEFYTEYSRINNSILNGIDKYDKIIPTRRGSVSRLMYHNLVVKDGMVGQEAKPRPPAFSSFEQYRSYLADGISGIIQNARDPTRNTPLRVLSTQSTGYDSTAINAIARDYGLDLALSINESKERHNYFGKNKRKKNWRSDSGDKICRQLGVKMCPIDRRYFQRDPESEVLYWAGVHNCQDMNLHQVSEHVNDGAVLLTGVLGEMWYNANSTPPALLALVNDQLERWDLSCHSLSEARLHIGYVHAPAPYIGARSRKSIFELTNSESMRQWSIGGDYDRPIPRRLGEDAGVPRHLFGQTKLATVVELQPPYLPHGKLLKKEFFNFVRRKRGSLSLMSMMLLPKINSTTGIISETIQMIMWKIPLPGRLKNSRIAKRLISLPKVGHRWNAVLYAYCINKTANLYVRSKSRPLGRSSV
jgi:hypothetical protein